MQTASITREGSVYTKSARFDKGERRLSENEMRVLAPSIFATEGHWSRSVKFAPIPTIEVLRKIAKEGFVPVGVKQSRSRDPGRAEFTKHLIRLRRLDGKQRQVGDTVFEMLLTNANDGTARYNPMPGLWRLRCMNSLVALHEKLAATMIRHSGEAAEEVLDARFKVLELADRTLACAENWGKVRLAEPERMSFARKAHKMRWHGKDYGVASAVPPGKLLEARRGGGLGSGLWSHVHVRPEGSPRGGSWGDRQGGCAGGTGL